MTRTPENTLDLNKPDDARKFILQALPECFDGIKVTHFTLEDGSKISTDKLSDSQAVQYAWELLPLYQAKFPELCDIQHEH